MNPVLKFLAVQIYKIVVSRKCFDFIYMLVNTDNVF